MNFCREAGRAGGASAVTESRAAEGAGTGAGAGLDACAGGCVSDIVNALSFVLRAEEAR